MSHFTTIKTKIKERPYLIEALELMGHNVQENQQLVINNPTHAEKHPEFLAEVAIRNDIGFRLNKNTGNYELVAELDTWDLDVPVSRFIDKVTQQYARMTLYNTVKEEGFEVAEEWEMTDNSLELLCVRWN
jgi:hypothetical protein|tara:strand:+ start:330 stop:722 length:393 start_codon:yes stop_codon:yes gene_type:complete